MYCLTDPPPRILRRSQQPFSYPWHFPACGSGYGVHEVGIRHVTSDFGGFAVGTAIQCCEQHRPPCDIVVCTGHNIACGDAQMYSC